MAAARLRVTIPAGLIPYLRDMLRIGIYGVTLRECVVEALQTTIRSEIVNDTIPLRVHGRIVRRSRTSRATGGV